MTLLIGAVVAAALVVLFLLLGPVAQWLTRGLPAASTPPRERQDALTANRDLLLKCLTGLLALGALVYTAKTFQVAQQQAATAAQSQVTDRYAKAIEELDASGPGKEDVRIGAVYALERLMSDSRRDHNAIVDVLSSFIRYHDQLKGDPSNKAFAHGDAQAALTVLGRRDRSGETHQLDLRKVRIAYLDLQKADFYHADLYEADLHGAHLDGADLQRASLVGAKLQKAHLPGADLSGAHLDRANLFGADLSQTRGLTCDQLRTAVTDATMRLPSDLSC
ncbi:pentapeptide repeat-containing protein [Streptomyces sp. NPDC091280]|uniref:pentapeptide repeat-containing protein n=1 Tax=Streptomyces sp. NPDC091280 TaxID=3365984 RepID=UPI0038108165